MRGRLYKHVRAIARANAGIYFLVRLIKFGPFMGLRNQRARRELLAQARADGWRVLNLGSGGRKQSAMVNLDVTPVTGPDVVGDGYHLPFRDSTFDLIMCDYVIEHVPDPEKFIAAARTALRDGGIFYFETPFLQPMHGGDADFTRWTRRGFIKAATRGGLNVTKSGIHLGPAFTLFWVLNEWLAIVFSFGVPALFKILNYIFRWLLSPLMIIDAMTLHLPGAERLASGFYVVASSERDRPLGRQGAEKPGHAAEAPARGPVVEGIAGAL